MRVGAYRRAVVALKAVAGGGTDAGCDARDVARARARALAAEALGRCSAGDSSQVGVLMGQSLDLAASEGLARTVERTAIEYASCADPETYPAVADSLSRSAARLSDASGGGDAAARGCAAALLATLRAHLKLLAPAVAPSSVTADLAAARNHVNTLSKASEARNCLDRYLTALELSAAGRQGNPIGLRKALDAFRETRTRTPPKVVPLAWPAAGAPPPEALQALYEGVYERSQAKVQDSVQLFSRALELTRSAGCGGGTLEAELKLHTAANYLISCELGACARLLANLIKRDGGLRQGASSRKRKRGSDIRADVGVAERGRKVTLLHMCGVYAEATGHDKEARLFFKRSYQLACGGDDAADAADGVGSALRWIVELHYLWVSLGSRPTPQVRASVAEQVQRLQAAAVDSGNVTVQAYSLVLLGLCEAAAGAAARGRERLRQALAVANSVQHKMAIASCLALIGSMRVPAAEGDPAEAKETSATFSSALMLAARMKDAFAQLTVLGLMCRDASGGEPQPPGKLRKIQGYAEKRRGEIAAQVAAARASDAHGVILAWVSGST